MKIFYLDIDINGDGGLNAISIVEHPATEVDFLKFAEESKPIEFKFDEDKHIVKGVAVVCDKPIKRYDDNGEEFYIVFTKECIEKLLIKFSKDKAINNVDLQHNGQLVDGVYLTQSYLIDRENGVDPIEFREISDHSWIVEYFISNMELWSQIKNGNTLNGFSVAGWFKMRNIFHQQFKEEEIKDIDTLIKEILK